MSAFSNFSNVLPDSIRTIGNAGQAGGQILALKEVSPSRGEAASQTPNDLDFVLNAGCVGQGAEFLVTTDSNGNISGSIGITRGGYGYAVGDVLTMIPASGNASGLTGLALEVTEVTTGNPSAGFKSVQVTSKAPIMKNRTNSGKLITRSAAYHTFSLSIGYNKLLKSEFMPIYTFLLEKQGSLKPFFVQLPQYGNGISSPVLNSLSVGDTILTLKRPENEKMPSIVYPSPGDLFTIQDTSNSNHTKAYMVIRVETNSEYTGSQPSLDEPRIHFTPPLTAGVTSYSEINFTTPTIKVVNKTDSLQYSLDQDNLYTFKLSLEEAIT